MPSDNSRLDLARERLASRMAGHREAVLLAADELDASLRSVRAPAQADRVPAFAATLGPLGAAHLDTDRLASLFGSEAPAFSGPALQAVERAATVLREAAGAGEVTHLDLASGANLTESVRAALAKSGRAFGAAHVVAVTRNGRYDQVEHGWWLDGYPFARWNRRERQLAPPLVVSLDGADLKAGGLAEFLDGGVTLVLLVRDNAAPPAALVRLVSPGVFVAQTLDGEALSALAGRTGPAVIAWVPAGSVGFVHDPVESPVLGARLRLQSDVVPPRRGLGGQSATQLAEELRQLEAMAGLGTAPAGGVTPGDSAEPIDRLAAWILTQADLSTEAVP